MNLKSIFQILVFLILGLSSISQAQVISKFQADEKWVKQELKRMKLPGKFIREALANYEDNQMERVLKLNLLGFLKPPQHMDRVTAEAVTESSRFLKDNKKEFAQAQKKYQVTPDVISALLWIETRHGENVGQFHIVSVYLDLLQADRAVNRQILNVMALEQNKLVKKYSVNELKKKMKERTFNKAKWAREEVRALATIYSRNQLNLKSLKGSYAGAFGLSQFIPSSYRDFAKSSKATANPNLMKPKDAILSVAHYLSKHGWKTKKSQSRISALMSYNNSRDYADSILEISKRVELKQISIKTGRVGDLKDRG